MPEKKTEVGKLEVWWDKEEVSHYVLLDSKNCNILPRLFSTFTETTSSVRITIETLED